MELKWVLIFCFLRKTVGQNDCNFYNKIDADGAIALKSQNYPKSYPGGIHCRLIVDCPVGYKCHLSCPEIFIPESPGCMLDKFLVSKSGDPQLRGADTYCGYGSLSVVSELSRISIGFITSMNTTGGRFHCNVSVQTVSDTCLCGYKISGRIVDGTETEPNEYPMMVGLIDSLIAQVKCGGVIISNYHILTAAHCFNSLSVDKTDVVVGAHNMNEETSLYRKSYKVASFHSHPKYDAHTYDYDIGIITLTEPIAFSLFVGPVCLPFKYQDKDFAGDKVTVLGWGTIFYSGPVSPTLLEVELDVINQTTCMKKEPTLTSREMCTYTSGKDSCQNDSGGPVMYTDPITGLLFSVGIVSHGRACASKDFPGVNTRVTSFVEWIVSTTKLEFCKK